jgi:hypothetical protein
LRYSLHIQDLVQSLYNLLNSSCCFGSSFHCLLCFVRSYMALTTSLLTRLQISCAMLQALFLPLPLCQFINLPHVDLWDISSDAI